MVMAYEMMFLQGSLQGISFMFSSETTGTSSLILR